MEREAGEKEIAAAASRHAPASESLSVLFLLPEYSSLGDNMDFFHSSPGIYSTPSNQRGHSCPHDSK